MGPGEIVGALEELRRGLPWVERFDVELGDDAMGEPAVFLRVVVRSGEAELFEDGERLGDARWKLREALAGAGVGLWPYIDFVSADELEAA